MTTESMTSEKRVARLFGLQGDHWMRHANKWSVWSRFSVLSLIALAIWSRDWIGWWCLIPVGLAVTWMMVNPLLFAAPRSTRNWASKSVLGERIWADRNTVEIPEQFRSPVPTNIANALAGVGLVLMAYGLITFDVLPTIAGVFIANLGKLWYLDRMVLLFDDMKHRDPEIAKWDY